MARGDAPYMKELADNYAWPTTTTSRSWVDHGQLLCSGDSRRRRLSSGRKVGRAPSPADRESDASAAATTSTPPTAMPAAPMCSAPTPRLRVLPASAPRWRSCRTSRSTMALPARRLLHGEHLDPGYQADGKPLPLGVDKFVLPPQSMAHIGDALSRAGVSWKWYSGGRNDGKTPDKEYCGSAIRRLSSPRP